MNISAVDMSGVAAGVPAVTEPKLPLDPSQMHRALGTDPEVVQQDQQEIKQVVAKMQEQIDSMNVSLQYSTYGDHGEKLAIAVVNKETGELIREIPPKELQNLYAKMSELAGMIFNRLA